MKLERERVETGIEWNRNQTGIADAAEVVTGRDTITETEIVTETERRTEDMITTGTKTKIDITEKTERDLHMIEIEEEMTKTIIEKEIAGVEVDR